MGRFAILGVVAVLGLALPASAVPYTFTYTGVVTQKTTGGPGSAFTAPWNNPGIVVGSPVTLSYTFESTSPDISASPVSGAFDSITQVSLTMGPATNTVNYGTPQRIYTANDLVFPNPPSYTTDRYGVLLNAGVGGNSDTLIFQMDDTTFSTFNTDALPLVQPNPSSFNNFFGSLESNGSFGTSEIRFVLTDVPEPAAIGALLLPGVAMLRRRKHG
jgi:hypothetical protein